MTIVILTNRLLKLSEEKELTSHFKTVNPFVYSQHNKKNLNDFYSQAIILNMRMKKNLDWYKTQTEQLKDKVAHKTLVVSSELHKLNKDISESADYLLDELPIGCNDIDHFLLQCSIKAANYVVNKISGCSCF